MPSIRTCVALPTSMVEELDMLHAAGLMLDPSATRSAVIRHALRAGLAELQRQLPMNRGANVAAPNGKEKTP